jgi:hypothetical protein
VSDLLVSGKALAAGFASTNDTGGVRRSAHLLFERSLIVRPGILGIVVARCIGR